VTLKVGDHPGFVRIAVGFTESPGRARIFAVDPSPFADGTSAVRIQRAGLAPKPYFVEGAGVHVNGAANKNELTLRMRSATHRFKYLEYRVLTHPDRLVIDLWKSRPPVRARLRAPDGCLTLRHYSVGRGVVNVFGRERNLFRAHVSRSRSHSRGEGRRRTGSCRAERALECTGALPRRSEAGGDTRGCGSLGGRRVARLPSAGESHLDA
jgi:hypothetical protein